MLSPRRAAFACALLGLGSARAWAQTQDYEPIRALGAGGAMRGVATGDAGPMLNPSGMPLVRTYSLEAAYLHGSADSAHGLHAAIVDSTSAFNIAGGLTYSFVHARPDVGPTAVAGSADRTGHDVRLALAVPFGDVVYVGATAKYLKYTKPTDGKGFTVDAGITVRPVQMLSVGIVGYNLRELDVPGASTLRGMGYGVAVNPWADLVLMVDGVTTFATAATGDKTKTSLMGGGEILLAKKVALRGGGGRDGVTDRTYAAVGASLVSEDGAIDAGLRQDLSGDAKNTALGISLRLFVPQP